MELKQKKNNNNKSIGHSQLKVLVLVFQVQVHVKLFKNGVKAQKIKRETKNCGMPIVNGSIHSHNSLRKTAFKQKLDRYIYTHAQAAI